MIDLKHFGGGRKLIEKVIRDSKPNSQPWTTSKQHETVRKIKNAHTPQSRAKSKY